MYRFQSEHCWRDGCSTTTRHQQQRWATPGWDSQDTVRPSLAPLPVNIRVTAVWIRSVFILWLADQARAAFPSVNGIQVRASTAPAFAEESELTEINLVDVIRAGMKKLNQDYNLHHFMFSLLSSLMLFFTFSLCLCSPCPSLLCTPIPIEKKTRFVGFPGIYLHHLDMCCWHASNL